MKISATLSEFRRDVMQILKAHEDNNSRNKVVSKLYPPRDHRINIDHPPGAEHVVWSHLPGDSSSRI